MQKRLWNRLNINDMSYKADARPFEVRSEQRTLTLTITLRAWQLPLRAGQHSHSRQEEILALKEANQAHNDTGENVLSKMHLFRNGSTSGRVTSVGKSLR
jgi:hypothetical protein